VVGGCCPAVCLRVGTLGNTHTQPRDARPPFTSRHPPSLCRTSPPRRRHRTPPYQLRRAPVVPARLAVGPSRGGRASRGRVAGLAGAKGLITYPSPLRLLRELPEVLATEVLPRLDLTDLTLLGRLGGSRTALVVSGLPHAGATRACLSNSLSSFAGPSSGWLGSRRTTALET
jgi:hypothetical protein